MLFFNTSFIFGIFLNHSFESQESIQSSNWFGHLAKEQWKCAAKNATGLKYTKTTRSSNPKDIKWSTENHVNSLCENKKTYPIPIIQFCYFWTFLTTQTIHKVSPAHILIHGLRISNKGKNQRNLKCLGRMR